MDYETRFAIGERVISNTSPTYFIADIGANHDASLTRAQMLIEQAAKAGAHCVKFQHFAADKIVSREGFKDLKVTHQAQWPKSVYEIYEDYSINRQWDRVLAKTAEDFGVDFMTTPYDFEAVAGIDPLVKAYKVGSGDITYLSLIRYIANRKKPIFLATGASHMPEVDEAVTNALIYNRSLCLMQCNTNYTGDAANFRYVNLRVLSSYAHRYPGMPLGLSDHTPGYTAVLGAIALGARVIEKHFTDDSSRPGPDHAFALTPGVWRAMTLHSQDLESALGTGEKIVEDNELESRVVQRRAIRLKDACSKGKIVTADMVEMLRPCPYGALTPADVNDVVGRVLKNTKGKGEELYPEDLI
jgi:N-acetylneuraminate synthase